MEAANERNIEIVNEIASKNILRDIIYTITKKGKEAKDQSSLGDLENDIFLSLMLDKNLPTIYDEGHLQFYLTRIVMNNIISSTSPYYRTYIKPRNFSVSYKDKWNNEST